MRLQSCIKSVSGCWRKTRNWVYQRLISANNVGNRTEKEGIEKLESKTRSSVINHFSRSSLRTPPEVRRDILSKNSNGSEQDQRRLMMICESSEAEQYCYRKDSRITTNTDLKKEKIA